MSEEVEYGGRLLRWLHRRPKDWGKDPDAVDPERLRHLHRRLGAVFGRGRWFELEVQGWEHVPEAPVMLVGNHSGGTSIPDVWGLLYAWFDHFGEGRIVHTLAHEMVFSAGLVGRPFSELGVLRAGPDRGREVLCDWRRDLLVLPGGDLDVWRPWTKRYQVRFAGRTGYARLALQTGVPIVPVAHAGAHDTLIVLGTGRRLARLLHLPEIARAEIWPVHLSLPWLVGFGPLPHLPLPARLRYRIGAPVPVRRVEGEPSEEEVAALDDEVRRRLQALLDELKQERPRLRERLRGTRRRLRRLARRLRR